MATKTPKELFDDWWSKTGSAKVSKIVNKWTKENEPNADEEAGGDYWHVNRMMHEGEAERMTEETAEEIFIKGANGEDWEPNQFDSFYNAELDAVIMEAYKAGKKNTKED